MLSPSATTYPPGTPEREILDAYRAKVAPAFSKAGFRFTSLLSVEAIRIIARDLVNSPPARCDSSGVLSPPTPPDILWTKGPQGTWQNGFEPIVAAVIAAEADYLAACAHLIQTRHSAPGARPVHT